MSDRDQTALPEVDVTFPVTQDAHSAVMVLFNTGLWGSTPEECMRRLFEAQLRHQAQEERRQHPVRQFR